MSEIEKNEGLMHKIIDIHKFSEIVEKLEAGLNMIKNLTIGNRTNKIFCSVFLPTEKMYEKLTAK